MSSDKLNRFWLLLTFILIIFIITSGFFLWVRRDNGQLINISETQSLELNGQISIDGAVISPGTYLLKHGDSVDDIIQASGGIDKNADMSRLLLYIPPMEESPKTQKININTADVWLLQALPGIGEIKAKAIVEYRINNGLFRTLEDITKVPGIGDSIFKQIEQYITLIPE
jgi:competence protein ComEA